MLSHLPQLESPETRCPLECDSSDSKRLTVAPNLTNPKQPPPLIEVPPYPWHGGELGKIIAILFSAGPLKGRSALNSSTAQFGSPRAVLQRFASDAALRRQGERMPRLPWHPDPLSMRLRASMPGVLLRPLPADEALLPSAFLAIDGDSGPNHRRSPTVLPACLPDSASDRTVCEDPEPVFPSRLNEVPSQNPPPATARK